VVVGVWFGLINSRTSFSHTCAFKNRTRHAEARTPLLSRAPTCPNHAVGSAVCWHIILLAVLCGVYSCRPSDTLLMTLPCPTVKHMRVVPGKDLLQAELPQQPLIVQANLACTCQLALQQASAAYLLVKLNTKRGKACEPPQLLPAVCVLRRSQAAVGIQDQVT